MTQRICYRVSEAAILLGLSRESLYKAIQRGDIATERINGRLVIPAAQLHERFGKPIEVPDEVLG